MKSSSHESPVPLHRGLRLSPSECTSLFVDGDWALRFPPVLTVDQAAELLQVPKRTLYDWSSRGLLKGCSKRVGRHLRILRDRLLLTTFNRGITEDERA